MRHLAAGEREGEGEEPLQEVALHLGVDVEVNQTPPCLFCVESQ